MKGRHRPPGRHRGRHLRRDADPAAGRRAACSRRAPQPSGSAAASRSAAPSKATPSASGAASGSPGASAPGSAARPAPPARRPAPGGNGLGLAEPDPGPERQPGPGRRRRHRRLLDRRRRGDRAAARPAARHGLHGRRQRPARWQRGPVRRLLRADLGPPSRPDPAGTRRARLGHQGPRRLPRVLRGGRGAGRRHLVLVRPRLVARRRPRFGAARRSAAAPRTATRAAGSPRTWRHRRRPARSRSGTGRWRAPATRAATRTVAPFWQALYAAHAEVVVNAHDRDYERFAPQDPAGHEDRADGIRQFVVGHRRRAAGRLRAVSREQRVPPGRRARRPPPGPPREGLRLDLRPERRDRHRRRPGRLPLTPPRRRRRAALARSRACSRSRAGGRSARPRTRRSRRRAC